MTEEKEETFDADKLQKGDLSQLDNFRYGSETTIFVYSDLSHDIVSGTLVQYGNVSSMVYFPKYEGQKGKQKLIGGTSIVKFSEWYDLSLVENLTAVYPEPYPLPAMITPKHSATLVEGKYLFLKCTILLPPESVLLEERKIVVIERLC